MVGWGAVPRAHHPYPSSYAEGSRRQSWGRALERPAKDGRQRQDAGKMSKTEEVPAPHGTSIGKPGNEPGTLELKERSLNVIENKGALWKTRGADAVPVVDLPGSPSRFAVPFSMGGTPWRAAAPCDTQPGRETRAMNSFLNERSLNVIEKKGGTVENLQD